MAQLVVLGPAVATATSPGAAGGAIGARIRVYAMRGQMAYDLTSDVEGLQWSSIKPIGDERASFRLKRRWFAGAPEIAQGNTLLITDGPEELWKGRIGDNDRAVDQAEQIGVVAYGLGARMRDGRIQRVYVDRDFNQWGEPPLARQLYSALTVGEANGDYQASAGDALRFLGSAGKLIPQGSTAQLMYVMPPGEGIKTLVYKGSEGSASNVESATFFVSDDETMVGAQSAPLTLNDILGATGSFTPQRYGMLRAYATAAHTPPGNAPFARGYSIIAVYGNNGIERRTAEGALSGFYISDLILDIAGSVRGIKARYIDQTSYILTHAVLREPVTHQAGVEEFSKFEDVGWGTWGSDNIFDRSSNGYFDWRQIDTETQHWFATRAECDDVDLHTELASVFNEVTVYYADPSGRQQTETRTTTVPVLDEADPPIINSGRVDGGTMDQADAQKLGDAFLALSAGAAPARGSVTLTEPIRHYRRGPLPPHFMRADGSNLRVPDVLPSRDLFSLTAAPDRRTTFPISRVDVDASGPVPKVRVDVDQANDKMSILQARLSVAASLVG